MKKFKTIIKSSRWVDRNLREPPREKGFKYKVRMSVGSIRLKIVEVESEWYEMGGRWRFSGELDWNHVIEWYEEI